MNHSNFRRQFLTFAGSALLLTGSNVFAATPVVEIIAFAHSPVESALKPLRQWLAQQGSKVRVVEADMEGIGAQRKLKAIGLTGHLPVVVLVDGQYRHVRKDGSTVEFVNFPGGPGTPQGIKTTWTSSDVEAVVKEKF
jgi:hypothetical protein